MIQLDGVTFQPGTSTEAAINVVPDRPVNGIDEMENYAKQIVNSLPKIDRDAWREEMLNMTVEISSVPTTASINQGLSLSQGYRERLSEMLLLAQREARIRRRCSDMLLDMVNSTSKASSADKRRAEYTGKYPYMVIQTEIAETFVKEIEQVYNNMKSNTDALSRQVSIMQLQLSLGEIRGTGSNGGNTPAEEIESTNQINYKCGTTSWGDID